MALFLLKTGTCEAKNTFESLSFMLYFVLLSQFVSKREGQIESKFDEQKFINLTAHSA